MEDTGRSVPDGLSQQAAEPEVSSVPASIPSAERRQIARFLAWWAKDQALMAESTADLDLEIEFSIRAQALVDAARDVLDFGDSRLASAIEARSDATGTGAAVGESAVAKPDAPDQP